VKLIISCFNINIIESRIINYNLNNVLTNISLTKILIFFLYFLPCNIMCINVLHFCTILLISMQKSSLPLPYFLLLSFYYTPLIKVMAHIDLSHIVIIPFSPSSILSFPYNWYLKMLWRSKFVVIFMMKVYKIEDSSHILHE